MSSGDINGGRRAPEGDMSRRVARGLEPGEASDLFGFEETGAHGMRRADPEPPLDERGPRRKICGGHAARRLHRRHVPPPPPPRDAEAFADRMARALVVGMRVCERMRVDLAA